MAAIPTSFTRMQPSLRGNRVQPTLVAALETPGRRFPNLQSSPRSGNLFMLPKEPEDARLTGGTRSLERRLLALNLSGSRARRQSAPERIQDFHPAVA